MSKIKVNQLETLDGSVTVNVSALASANHGALTGLADDDHPQYYNQARGDARYSQTSHTHAVGDVTGLQTALNELDAKKVSKTGDTISGNLNVAGNVLAIGGALGYGAGAGGSVSQETSKGNGVVLNKPSGVITTHNSVLAGNTAIAFTVTNSFVSFTDTVVCNVVGGTGDVNAYIATAFPYHGGFYISLRNMTSNNLTDNVKIRFNTIKGS